MCDSSQKLKSGIYKIINLITGMIYIGSSLNIRTRWNTHKHYLRHNKHPNRYLQFAWNKYGEENFKFEILQHCENIIEREQIYIDWLDTLAPKGYNLAKIAGSQIGMRHTEKTKNIISVRFKNKPKSPEHVAKVAASMIGKKRPDLTERNKARAGAPISIEARLNMSKAQKGRKHSEETRAKMSASAKIRCEILRCN